MDNLRKLSRVFVRSILATCILCGWGLGVILYVLAIIGLFMLYIPLGIIGIVFSIIFISLLFQEFDIEYMVIDALEKVSDFFGF